MNKHLIIALFLLIVASCAKNEKEAYLFSYFIGNGQDGLHLSYSDNGFNFKELNNNNSFLTPTVGNDKLMRDPCIISGPDGEFHMVWTISWNERGIGYAHSKDLLNWSEQKYIPVMEYEPDAWNCWAPELFYDNDKEMYMIYWATTIPGRFPETDSTGDKGYNHRIYYTTTKDFERFTETKLLYNQGFNVIDAVIVKIDSIYTMFLKDETRHPPQKNIRIASSKNLTEGYSEPSEKITIDWVEGPTVMKIDDDWIVYFDIYKEKRMGAVKSKDLVHWTDISDEVSFPKGTRHGTIFKVNQDILDKLMQ